MEETSRARALQGSDERELSYQPWTGNNIYFAPPTLTRPLVAHYVRAVRVSVLLNDCCFGTANINVNRWVAIDYKKTLKWRKVKYCKLYNREETWDLFTIFTHGEFLLVNKRHREETWDLFTIFTHGEFLLVNKRLHSAGLRASFCLSTQLNMIKYLFLSLISYLNMIKRLNLQ